MAFVFNLKGGTFQSLLWYKCSYDSAKAIAFCITTIAPDKSESNTEVLLAEPDWPSLIMKFRKYLSSLHYVQWVY